MIECMHSFCTECIMRWAKTCLAERTWEDGTYGMCECPTCRTKSDGVEIGPDGGDIIEIQ